MAATQVPRFRESFERVGGLRLLLWSVMAGVGDDVDVGAGELAPDVQRGWFDDLVICAEDNERANAGTAQEFVDRMMPGEVLGRLSRLQSVWDAFG